MIKHLFVKNSHERVLFFSLLIGFIVLSSSQSNAQVYSESAYGSGLTVPIGNDENKYFRLITWHQVWARYNENNTGSTRLGVPQESTTDFGLRRSRFLMYAQLNKRFLILTHFGINNQNAISGGVVPSDGKKPQLFMHDAWTEFNVYKKYLDIGFGLHYWNGISRLANASTLNFMTIDAPIFNWATIEATDQFARFIGIYAKGQIGKTDYRVSVSDPFLTNTGQTIRNKRRFFIHRYARTANTAYIHTNTSRTSFGYGRPNGTRRGKELSADYGARL